MSLQAWEDYLRNRSGPPSTTEQSKCDNAERLVREALHASPSLQKRNYRVFLQGSYRNNTNTRQDSDVDVAILCTDTYFFDGAENLTLADMGWEPVTYDYATYKAEVGQALVSAFGQAGVTRGDKAFDIHENTYRVEADVAPFFEYRFYYDDGSYITGVAMDPDSGGPRVVNYPEQHYANCVAKNERTARRYKQVVRIVKRLRNDLGLSHADKVTGFFIECALYNVSDQTFVGTYYDMTRRVIAEAYGLIENDANDQLLEANGVKYLFHPFQKWTKPGALLFLNELFAAMHRS